MSQADELKKEAERARALELADEIYGVFVQRYRRDQNNQVWAQSIDRLMNALRAVHDAGKKEGMSQRFDAAYARGFAEGIEKAEKLMERTIIAGEPEWGKLVARQIRALKIGDGK